MTKSIKIDKRLLEWWCCGGGTRINSEAIVFVMCGLEPEIILDKYWTPYPHDSNDFGRCYRLLQAMPEWKERIKEMACLGKVWEKIADAWLELEALYAFEKHKELYHKLNELSKDDENVDKVDLGNGVSISVKPCEQNGG